MGFLLLSFLYPTEAQRKAFLKEVGPIFAKSVSPFHMPLAASANETAWSQILNIFRENVDTNMLRASSLRPLRPDDDNYTVFVGKKWRPQGNFSHPPELSAMLGVSDKDPVPHYDRCAHCTSLCDNMKRCSRCKFVLYCSKECQSKHWKQCHKTSCVPAQETTLEQAMTTNDGFYITPEECKLLSKALSESVASIPNLKPFAVYFNAVSELNGCFVL